MENDTLNRLIEEAKRKVEYYESALKEAQLTLAALEQARKGKEQ